MKEWHLEKYKFKKGQPAWNDSRVKQLCTVCSTPFLVPPSAVHKRSTCSRKCMGIAKQKPIPTEKRCPHCGETKPVSEFNKNRAAAHGYCNVCKPCQIKKNLAYRQRNREKVRTRARAYMRQFRIGQGSKKDFRNVKNKRPYPQNDRCEMCREHKPMKLVYHHWDDNNFSKGLWICRVCHTAAHWLDKHKPQKYFKIKKSIDLLFKAPQLFENRSFAF